jgi:chemotaxis protein CheD
VHVIQGEHAVSANPNALMTTVLGSCVAACIHDPVAGVGGINGLMKLGARRERLEAKLFGGAKLFEGLNDVGAANASFARRFLEDEGIPITAASLGGRKARRVEFFPATGRARQREVDQNPETPTLKRAPAPVADAGGVELF